MKFNYLLLILLTIYLYSIKIFIISVFILFFGRALSFSQKVSQIGSVDDSTLKFDLERTIDNVSVIGLTPEKFSASEYDSVMYLVKDNSSRENNYLSFSKSNFEKLNKNLLKNGKIQIATIDNKTILKYLFDYQKN